MLRRNFLRNAAFTLPVAMVAPEALLANTNKAAHQASIIIVGSGAAAVKAAELLAANHADLLVLAPDNTVATTAASQTLAQKQVTKISCNKQGFLLTDSQGNAYSTSKVIFATTASFCDSSAKVYVQTTASKKVTMSIKFEDANSATCWAANNGANARLLSSFANSKKTAFMCLS